MLWEQEYANYRTALICATIENNTARLLNAQGVKPKIRKTKQPTDYFTFSRLKVGQSLANWQEMTDEDKLNESKRVWGKFELIVAETNAHFRQQEHRRG